MDELQGPLDKGYRIRFVEDEEFTLQYLSGDLRCCLICSKPHNFRIDEYVDLINIYQWGAMAFMVCEHCVLKDKNERFFHKAVMAIRNENYNRVVPDLSITVRKMAIKGREIARELCAKEESDTKKK